jgi:hypothetical protein
MVPGVIRTATSKGPYHTRLPPPPGSPEKAESTAPSPSYARWGRCWVSPLRRPHPNPRGVRGHHSSNAERRERCIGCP